MLDKENLSRWWGKDMENPRDEPFSLDHLALARSRREVHLEGFPILTSSTWLIIYLAYFLPKPHSNQMFFGLQSIWHIYRVGKCRLTSPSDWSQFVYLRIQKLVTGKNDDRKDFLSLWSKKIVKFDTRYWINICWRQRNKRYVPLYDLSSVDHVIGERQGHVMG